MEESAARIGIHPDLNEATPRGSGTGNPLREQLHLPTPGTLHELFEAQARNTPEAVAVVCEGGRLTYTQLNAAADHLAGFLRTRGVCPDQLVGLSVERGLQMVVGLLGIWKAGGAYLPLDPAYPSEHLAHILGDAAPPLLLTQDQLEGRFSNFSGQVISLDGALTHEATPSPARLRSHHLAYVIYTSGSTGKPKGVMIEHRHVINLWQGLEHIYHQADGCDRVGVNASLNFDASVKQLVQLCSGRTLVLVPERVRRDPSRLVDFIATHQIEGIDCTPSQLKAWISAGLLEGPVGSLKMVLLGGEALDGDLWNRLAQWPHINFFNVYGPTECTVDATVASLRHDASGPHIGRPMVNKRLYILDENGAPTPVGVTGEIHIGGAGVARGYLNKPELTAQRFIQDPFSLDPQARLYKTGDVGRWRPDGAIEYLGRNDNQVKLRGFRIELEEIEAHLVQHARVKEAVVLAREDRPGEKRLVAYVSAKGEPAPSVEALRTHLQSVLPEYMVPSAFVVVDHFPLTSSGKLDRRALPAPESDAYLRREYEAPRGALEEVLAGIWEQLLHVERVSRHDNFFELGGHSLLIVQLLERLRGEELSVEVCTVFATPTLADLANSLKTGRVRQYEVPPNGIPAHCETLTPAMLPLVQLEPGHIEHIVHSEPGGAKNIQDIYPLAPLQEGILFHHLLTQQKGDTYVVVTLLSLASRNTLDRFVEALQAVIDRHDVLRTAVLWEQLPQPVQVVYREARLTVQQITLDPDSDPREQIEDWMRPERQRLDLRHAPLLQLRVAEDPRSGEWYVLLQVHHIISDHVTEEVVISELVAHLEGRAQGLPDSMPYRNHVAETLQHARKYDAEAFFRRKLGDIGEPTVPFDVADVRGDGTQTREVQQALDSKLAKQVRSQARRLNVGAAALFHAAWGLVVAHTSGREDVVYGTVLSGRLQGSAGAQRMLGMFINTLPLRLRLAGVSARELVEQTQRELVELLDYEQASLAAAQRCSGISGSAPLFSTLLNYLHSSSSPHTAGSHWTSGVRRLGYQEWTNYPISVSVDDSGEAFKLTLQSERRIDARRMTQYLQVALGSLVQALEEAPTTSALSLAILPENERRKILELFNAPQAHFPQEHLIHVRFEAQVLETPHSVAAVYEGQSLTYAQLNSRANQLARYLAEKSVRPDELVGICVERGIDLVVAVLGTLKAGGAYVPLDPGYPAERLAYLLADAAPRVLLTQQALLERLPESAADYVVLDSQWSRIAQLPDSNLGSRAGLHPGHLAYVIYTSGSTGKPKGVMVEHRNVTRLFASTEQWFGFNASDVWTLFHSFAFDFSVWELWGALLHGGRLVIVPHWLARSPQEFYGLLCAEGVTVLNQTPSAFLQIIDAQAHSEQRHSLRIVIFGGEALELRTLRPWVERNGASTPQLVNMYGITETTVHVTYRPLSKEEIETEQGSPVGKPIPDLRVYILDARQHPVPIGVVGELYVAGAGVARGYLNRPELSAERFLPDPFSTDPRARMYKTGDLGRWHADGSIEFLGRNDQQVKIRGFRIELGEIEAQLARHAQIKDALVLAREDVPGDKRLVAYITPHESETANIEALRSHLTAVLPEHMLPSAFVVLRELPLTWNGKLDRRALPAPDTASYVTRHYEPPEGEIEESVAAAWKAVLRVERVGRLDNFFELGGNSLLAMQVMVRLGSLLTVDVPIGALFESPTLEQFSARVETVMRQKLLEGIEGAGPEIEAVFDQVASMPDHEVRELIRELGRGAQP